MRLARGSELQLPVSLAITRVNNQHSVVYCVASVLWIVCSVFLHVIMYTKCPSMTSASAKRKAITNAPPLTMGLCPDSVSSLSTSEVS